MAIRAERYMITGDIKEITPSGLTNILSDYDCADGDLHVCHNMISDGAGLKAIEQPKELFSLGKGLREVVFVHDTTFGRIFIALNDDGTYEYGDSKQIASDFTPCVINSSGAKEAEGEKVADDDGDYTIYDGKGNIVYINVPVGGVSERRIKLGDEDMGSSSDYDYSFSCVGNVLVVNISPKDEDNTDEYIQGLCYFCAMRGDGYMARYKYLGQRPPDVNLQFALEYDRQDILKENNCPNDNIYFGDGNVIHFKGLQITVGSASERLDNAVPTWGVGKDQIMALINEHVSNMKDQSRFLQPFFVRYAYRLYDGSYMMQSTPVLMCPDSGQLPFVFIRQLTQGDKDDGTSYANFDLFSKPCSLMVKIDISEGEYEKLKAWEDIIEGIGVFITPQILSYSESGSEMKYTELESIYKSDNPQKGYVTHNGDAGKISYAIKTGAIPQAIFKGGTYRETYDGKVMRRASDYNKQDYYNLIRSDGESTFHILDGYLFNTQMKMMDRNGNTYTGIVGDGIWWGFNSSDEYVRRYFSGGYKRNGAQKDWVLDAMSTFYEFVELNWSDIDELRSYVSSKYYAETPSEVDRFKRLKRDGGIKNLETFTQLPDGYHERTIRRANFMHSYNGRLNIANVEEKEIEDISPQSFSCLNEVSRSAITDCGTKVKGLWEVFIEDNGVLNTVSAVAPESGNLSSMPGFLFYPNPNAKYIRFTWRYGRMCEIWWRLSPHPSLSGSYFFNGYYGLDTSYFYRRKYYNTSYLPIDIENKKEGWLQKNNYMYTSSVDNPFNFPSIGVNMIGSGKIVAVKTATKAVSEGTAFGSAPLYAFCTDGIWSLSVGTDGVYTAKQPVSRETLAGDEPSTVTSIDNSIVFLSDRGLMELAGGDTRLVSRSLSGRDNTIDAADLPLWNTIHKRFDGGDYIEADDFVSFIKDGVARVAFDYERYRIIVYRVDKSTAYVYDLSSESWATMRSDIISSLEGYPSTWLNIRSGDKTAFCTFTQDERTPLGDGKAFYLTRPMKLGEADTLKTVRTLMERGVHKPGETRYTALWGSRDMRYWQLIGAVEGGRMPRLSGTPYKWFIVGGWAHLSDVTERISRLTIESKSKYTDKLR